MKLQTTCHTCALTRFCLPMGLSEAELQQLEKIVNQRQRFVHGETLKQFADDFHNFYAIRSGAVKSVTMSATGDEYIFGFYLSGEIVGFEALPTKKYPYSIVALTDTILCEIPFTAVMEMANTHTTLQHQLLTLASQSLTYKNCIHLTTAQQKVVAFLLNISERLNKTHTIKHALELPMSRQDIGNHLGLAMETISRVLNQLQVRGMITLQHRTLELIKLSALKAIADGHEI